MNPGDRWSPHPEQPCRSAWRSSQEVVALAHSSQHALPWVSPQAGQPWQGGWTQPRFNRRIHSVSLLSTLALLSNPQKSLVPYLKISEFLRPCANTKCLLVVYTFSIPGVPLERARARVAGGPLQHATTACRGDRSMAQRTPWAREAGRVSRCHAGLQDARK